MGKIGKDLMREGCAGGTSPSWLAEVNDGGHWSVSDLCALVKGFKPGCGAGQRQDAKSDFTYLDIDQGRSVASGYAAAFFAWSLRGEERGRAFITGNHPDATVSVSTK